MHQFDVCLWQAKESGRSLRCLNNFITVVMEAKIVQKSTHSGLQVRNSDGDVI
jgi:hypothetical protein